PVPDVYRRPPKIRNAESNQSGNRERRTRADRPENSEQRAREIQRSRPPRATGSRAAKPQAVLTDVQHLARTLCRVRPGTWVPHHRVEVRTSTAGHVPGTRRCRMAHLCVASGCNRTRVAHTAVRGFGRNRVDAWAIDKGRGRFGVGQGCKSLQPGRPPIAAPPNHRLHRSRRSEGASVHTAPSRRPGEPVRYTDNQMKNSPPQFSPQAYARIGGVLYLIIIAAGLFAEAFVRDRLIVGADAAATATNIMAHALMFRLGIAADLSTFLCAIPLTVILYVLLKPVDRNLALLMVIFNFVQDAIGGLNALNTYKPLQLLGGADYLRVFSPEQLQAMALLSLKAHAVGFGLALIFFGFSCLAPGYLIFASGFLPKALGMLMAIAGACYLINSFAL